jgi:tetratricopeptide (TPR) repeat protein
MKHMKRPYLVSQRGVVMIGLSLICAVVATLISTTHAQVGSTSLTQSVTESINSGEAAEIIPQLDDVLQSLTEQFGRDSIALIEPLGLRGKALASLGDHQSAIVAFDEAIHIARVQRGLFTGTQIENVYEQAKSYRAIGNYDKWIEREEYAFEVAERNKSEDPLSILSPLARLAENYEIVGNHLAAREMYGRGLLELANNVNADEELAVPFLFGLAETHLNERFPARVNRSDARPDSIIVPARNPTDIYRQYETNTAIGNQNFVIGKKALEQALSIRQKKFDVFESLKLEDAVLEPKPLNSHDESKSETLVGPKLADNAARVAPAEKLKDQKRDPEFDLAAQNLREAIVQLADWQLIFEKSRSAAKLYTRAHEVQQVLPESRPFSTDEPVLLLAPKIIPAKAPPEEDRLPQEVGFVKLSFDVRSNGRARKIKTVSTSPGSNMVFKVRKSIRDAVFRPALIDGAPVIFENFEYLYQYPFFPSRSDREKKESQRKGDKNVDGEGAASLPDILASVLESSDLQGIKRPPRTVS